MGWDTGLVKTFEFGLFRQFCKASTHKRKAFKVKSQGGGWEQKYKQATF